MKMTNIETSEMKGEKSIVETKEEKVEKKETSEKKVEEKKTEAIVGGRDLPISKKHSMAICNFIRGKKPDRMINELEKVAKLKKAIKMRGEIQHRKGMMSGRYPINASKVFIKLLKSLIANANVSGLENIYIATAKADDASRPFKRGGSQRFKRTNILLVAKEEKTGKKEGEI